MGQALGQLYVEEYFPPAAKARAQELVDNVRNALNVRIEHLAWMSDETKTRSPEQWSTFLPQIGYPYTSRSSAGLDIGPDAYLATVREANGFNQLFDLDYIRFTPDRSD